MSCAPFGYLSFFQRWSLKSIELLSEESEQHIQEDVTSLVSTLLNELVVTNFVVSDVPIGIDHSLRAAASFICDHKEKSDERRYRYPQ